LTPQDNVAGFPLARPTLSEGAQPVLALNMNFVRTLVILGINLFFLAYLPAVFSFYIWGLYPLMLLSGAGLLGWAAVLILRYGAPPKAVKDWVTATGLITVWMILRTIPNGDYGNTLYHLLPWVYLVFFPVLGYPIVWEGLLRTLSIHALIGVAFSLVFLIQSRTLIASVDVSRPDVIDEVTAAQGMLYSVPFLLYLYPLLPWQRIIAALGILELVVIGISAETRQTIFLNGLIIGLALWIRWKGRDLAAAPKYRRVDGNMVLNYLILLFFAWSIMFISPTISTRIEGLKTRFDLLGEDQSSRSRSGELSSLVEQFNPLDLLLGRGVRGGYFVSDVPGLSVEYTEFVHMGFGHVLLKGGIILFLVFTVVFIRTGIRAIILAKDRLVVAASAMVIWYLAKNLFGNLWRFQSLSYILILICFGACLYWFDAYSSQLPAFHKPYKPVRSHENPSP